MSQCLGIVGSNQYRDYEEFCKIVNLHLANRQFKTIISSGAPGTDKMAEKLAHELSLRFELSSSPTSTYGSTGKTSHASQIVGRSDEILAFVDPKSIEIWSIITLARSQNKVCHVFNISSSTSNNSLSPPSPYPYSIPGIPIAREKIKEIPRVSAVDNQSTTLVSKSEAEPHMNGVSPGSPSSPSTVLSPSRLKLVVKSTSTVLSPVSSNPVDTEEKAPLEANVQNTTPISAPKIKLVIRSKPPSEIIKDDWTITRICKEAVYPGWEPIFADASLELQQISELIANDEKTYMSVPLKKNIFRALEVLPLNRVRVVIWGQDPYFQMLSNGLPRAVGLSFSVSRTDEIPRSLSNIYREIINSVQGFTLPRHGDLSRWSTQGVLLLNASLTCRLNDPNSHAKYDIWLPFIIKVLKALNTVRPNCIHLLWGKEAQKLQRHIGDRATVLTSSHPSPMSADRGFFGCGHFAKVNQLLQQLGEAPIDWNLP
jgi:uracil-DNA glycosylase